MGNTWVTDMQHFLNLLDPAQAEQMPAAAMRLGCHLGRIVEAVTAGWHDRSELIGTVVPCRRRPARKPCLGIIGASMSADGRRIEWGCSNCNDNGVITGWQNTAWDFSGVVGHGLARGGRMAELVVTRDEHEALRHILTLDMEAERVVKAARLGPEDDQVLIEAPSAWLNNLLEHVAAEANHTTSKRVEARLATVLAKAEW